MGGPRSTFSKCEGTHQSLQLDSVKKNRFLTLFHVCEQVLLCQFHALKYFCHVVSTEKLRVGVEKQSALENHFRGLMYASHELEFESRWEEFVHYISKHAPNVFSYFEKN